MRTINSILQAVPRPPGCTIPAHGFTTSVIVDRGELWILVSHPVSGYASKWRPGVLETPQHAEDWEADVQMIGLPGVVMWRRRDGQAWEILPVSKFG